MPPYGYAEFQVPTPEQNFFPWRIQPDFYEILSANFEGRRKLGRIMSN